MHHQLRVAAEQLRRIDAQRQIGADPGRAIAVNRLFGVALGPGRSHRG